MSFQNRRQFQRIQYEGQANLKFVDDTNDSSQIKNLSLTGMYVAGDFPHQQIQHCIVDVVCNGNVEKICMQLSGQIVWSNEHGMGIKFLAMSLDNYMLLVSALIDNAEQPLRILNEIPTQCPFEISSEKKFSL